jgi:phosphoglycolate phosphatase
VIELVVFDLDGTLVDSSRDLADAVNALVADGGGVALGVDQVTAMVGEGAAVLVRRALSAAGLDPETPGALAQFLAHYDAQLTTHTKPYPGIPEALAALADRGLVLAVLTNKPEHQTLEILRRLGLASAFPYVIGGDTPAGRKPDPSGLMDIVARSGATPATTILVGDSPIDLATARRAGTRICLARYGFGYRFEPNAFRGDELFVDTPAELLSRL